MKLQFCLALILGATTLFSAQAQYPNIDRLLKKLPPPEKIVQPQMASGMRMNDPAFREPIVQELNKAMRAGNAARGLELARKLSARYPKSVFAHFLHGATALDAAAAISLLREYALVDEKRAKEQVHCIVTKEVSGGRTYSRLREVSGKSESALKHAASLMGER